jgi:hypothetical protein
MKVVYGLFHDGRLYYVDATSNIERRMRQHCRARSRVGDWIRGLPHAPEVRVFEALEDHGAALRRAGALIDEHRPQLNGGGAVMTVNFRVERPLLAAVKQVADYEGLTMSTFIKRALRHAVKERQKRNLAPV